MALIEDFGDTDSTRKAFEEHINEILPAVVGMLKLEDAIERAILADAQSEVVVPGQLEKDVSTLLFHRAHLKWQIAKLVGKATDEDRVRDFLHLFETAKASDEAFERAGAKKSMSFADMLSSDLDFTTALERIGRTKYYGRSGFSDPGKDTIGPRDREAREIDRRVDEMKGFFRPDPSKANYWKNVYENLTGGPGLSPIQRAIYIGGMAAITVLTVGGGSLLAAGAGRLAASPAGRVVLQGTVRAGVGALGGAASTGFGQYLRTGSLAGASPEDYLWSAAAGAVLNVVGGGVLRGKATAGSGRAMANVQVSVQGRAAGFALPGAGPAGDFARSGKVLQEAIDVARSQKFIDRARSLGFSDEAINALPARLRQYGGNVGEIPSGGWADAKQFLVGRSGVLSRREQRIMHELGHVLDDVAHPGLFGRAGEPGFGFRGFYRAERVAYSTQYGPKPIVVVPLSGFNAAAQAYPVGTKVVVGGLVVWAGYETYEALK